MIQRNIDSPKDAQTPTQDNDKELTKALTMFEWLVMSEEQNTPAVSAQC